ncbi:MAG: 3-dehydroquinate synthase [Ignavibacteriales bacterium]|nr:3-dehydroquinate synthase [Ignavibacteriales bacterium]
MKTIKVNASSKSYPVYIGSNSFSKLERLIKSKKLYENIFFIIDKNVFTKYDSKINSLINNNFKKKSVFVFEANEKNKSFDSAKNIYNKLIKDSFGRDTTIISIGGGITGDLAAFVASTFGRGTNFVQVPTTLLSMVDSSVGGKTGINFSQTKNLIGTFFQPDFVLIDLDFLKSLPDEELICGLGETVKYFYLTGESFYKNIIPKILENNLSQVKKIIFNSINYKARIVESDEKESGLRKVLNLGHTFAHAIEVEQNHKIKHGQAVIVGIVCSLFLSHKLELISEMELDTLLELPLKFQKFISIDGINTNSIFKIMKRDKKNRNGKIKFVLVKNPGQILIDVEAEKDFVIHSLEKGLSLFI